MFRKCAWTVIFFAAHAAQSATWDRSLSRGLDVYSVEADGGSFVMVCDPERVYSNDKSYANFVLSLDSHPAPSLVSFLSDDGTQAFFKTVNGTISQQDADPAEWERLVMMIKEGGSFSAVTSESALTIELSPMPEFQCQ